MKALQNGLEIQTIQTYSKCKIDPDVAQMRSKGALKINYYFEPTADSINYYNTELMVDIHAKNDSNAIVMYNVVNATITAYNNNGSLSTYLLIHSSYLNAHNLSTETHADISCELSNNTEIDGFYFTIPDEKTAVDRHYRLRNFEELFIAMEHGANVRMRMNMSSNLTDIVYSGSIIEQNDDIFNIFMSGVHSERIGSNWESFEDVFISWTTQQFIHDPFSEVQFYIISTNVVDIEGKVNVHSAVLDASMNVMGWINASAPLKDNIVSFYSDLQINV